MKRGLLVIGLFLCLSGSAEAGVGNALKNISRYAGDIFVCAVVEAGQKIVEALVEVSTCLIARANRNPVTLTSPLLGAIPSTAGSSITP